MLPSKQWTIQMTYSHNMPQTSANSILTQKMMDEQVQPGTFRPPLYNLSPDVRQPLDKLLEMMKSQYGER